MSLKFVQVPEGDISNDFACLLNGCSLELMTESNVFYLKISFFKRKSKGKVDVEPADGAKPSKMLGLAFQHIPEKLNVVSHLFS